MATKTLLVCLAVVALLALTAGVVMAEAIQGAAGRDHPEGFARDDAMRALEGSDDLLGRSTSSLSPRRR